MLGLKYLLTLGNNNTLLVIQESKRILFKSLNIIQHLLKELRASGLTVLVRPYNRGVQFLVKNDGLRGLLDKVPRGSVNGDIANASYSLLLKMNNLIRYVINGANIQAGSFFDDYLDLGKPARIEGKYPSDLGRSLSYINIEVHSTLEVRKALKKLEMDFLKMTIKTCDLINNYHKTFKQLIAKASVKLGLNESFKMPLFSMGDVITFSDGKKAKIIGTVRINGLDMIKFKPELVKQIRPGVIVGTGLASKRTGRVKGLAFEAITITGINHR